MTTTQTTTTTSTHDDVEITFVEASENNGAMQRVVVYAQHVTANEKVLVGMIEKSCLRRQWTLTQYGTVVCRVSKAQGLRILQELAFVA
jgi:hypothetical protein